MKRLTRLSATTAAIVLGVASLVANAAAPAQAASRGVDINGYCAATYAGAQGKAVTVSNDAYGWRCQLRDSAFGTHNVGINMTLACRWQYGNNTSAFLINNDSSSLYNWRCS